MKSIRQRVLLTFLLVGSVLVLGIGIYNIGNLMQLKHTETRAVKKILYDDYDSMIKNEVETAVNVLNTYYKLYQKGTISEKEAQDTAKEVIKGLRYGKEGYFWIDNTEGILIAHPIQPQNEGNNRINITDPKGVKLIQNIVTAATKNGSGYNEYMWEKPKDSGSGKLSPKRVYSQLFKPWKWIVSTGNYVDIMNATVQAKDESLNHNLQNDMISTGIFILISLLVIGYFAVRISKHISSPVIKLGQAFEKDENGLIRIEKVDINRKDEIGVLADTLNELSEQIKGFINGVVLEAENVGASSRQMDDDAVLLDNMVHTISDTVMGVSGEVEETASSCEEMNASSMEIVNSVDIISDKSDEAVNVSREISNRAEVLKSDLNQTVDHATVVLNEMQDSLRSAIEDSQSVKQINLLAEDILKITRDTNLLALNASIEASRAGESGAGFAVVAKEIRTLADNSKKTTTKIKKIIEQVTASVDKLSENSNELLQFVLSDVTNDYDRMLKASDEYSNDARNIEDLIVSFHSVAKQLHSSMQGMMKAIEDITSAADEEAHGASNIAESINTADEKTDRLLDQAKIVNGYSENLLKLVARFKL